MKNTNPDGLWKVEYGELGATLKSLQDRGVTLEHLARIRSDSSYADRVAKFMLQGRIEGSIHQKLVRTIMGNENFWGVEEWSAVYGMKFSKKQEREIAEFPWSEDILKATCELCGKIVKDCHFAFVGLDKFNGQPLTIMKLRELHPRFGQPRLYYKDPWYKNQKFATQITADLRWYLLHKEIVPNSTRKTFSEQAAMLPESYEIPSAVIEAAKDILFFKKNGIYLNSHRYARCQDMDSYGYHVNVGSFDRRGLVVNYWWDNHHFDFIGLAASRKY